MKQRSVKSKLILLIVIVFVVIIGVLSTFNYKSTSNEVMNLYGSIQRGVLDASYTTVNISMNIEAQQHLEAIAKEILAMDHQNIIAQRQILLTTQNLIKYPTMFIAYENGDIIIQDEGQRKELSNNWDRTATDFRQRDWYKQTKQSLKSIVTPVYESNSGANAGKSVATITYPLIKNGQFIGVLGFDIFIEGFQERFVNFKRRQLPSLDVYITDTTGRIISHADPKVVAHKELYPQEIQLQKLLQTSQKGSFEYIDMTGYERIGYYKQFPFGWTIVASVAKKDYVGGIRDNFLYATSISITLLLIGLIILFFFIKKLISPLEKIKDVLLHFFNYLNHETKENPKLLNISSNDEFGVIAKAINNNIEKTESNLKQDEELVKNALEVIEITKSGDPTKRITPTGSNPQLNQLRNSVNELLDLICSAVCKDLPALNKVFDSYTNLDFTTSIDNAQGRVEIVTNILGDEIRKMLKASLEFAHLLSSESEKLQQAVGDLNKSSNVQAASLEETAAALEEITSSMQNVSQKTSDVITQSEEIKNVTSI
ncbi:methyl-accepting chemotaxis protein, partial [Campylobacter jejuni]|nr:methyl-accepting chemotaxis protein [Campylobacter jejuni]